MLRRVGQVNVEIVFITELPPPDCRRIFVACDDFLGVSPDKLTCLTVGVAELVDGLGHDVRHSAHVPEQRGNQPDRVLLRRTDNVIQYGEIRLLVPEVKVPVNRPEAATHKTNKQYVCFGKLSETLPVGSVGSILQCSIEEAEVVSTDSSVGFAGLDEQAILHIKPILQLLLSLSRPTCGHRHA